MKDHTKGEIKMVRGSGPPILTADGHQIAVADVLFLLESSHYRGCLPVRCEVIGIDLTRRTVRLQVTGGKELLYSADGNDHRSSYWLFGNSDRARSSSIAQCQKSVKYAESEADRVITRLEDAKAMLKQAENWWKTAEDTQ